MEEKDQQEEYEDLGFGTKLTSSSSRFIHNDGSLNVERVGNRILAPYQSMLEMSWGRFLLLVLGFFIVSNLFFACLFCLSGVENLRGVEMDGPLPAFWEAFFFSIQSFTTVGYGAISPTGLWTNVIAALDALTGLLAFAIATGLIFARFSKPRARILFSQHALIAPYHGMESFQFRIVNMRSNKIIDLSARVTMTWLERQPDGRKRRQFAALPLERDQVFLFPLNWTIVHPIDEKSPLWGKTAQDLERMGVEFLILLKGHDETYNQIVHSSSSYISEEIVWNARFQPMYYQHENGTTLEIDKIDDIKRLESRS